MTSHCNRYFIKKARNNKCWAKMYRTGTLMHFAEMYIGTITVEISMKISQKIKNRTTVWTTSSYFQVFIWRKQPNKQYIYIYIYTSLFTELSSTGKTWQQLMCPLMGEWIKKMWHMYNGKLLGHKKKKKERNLAICNNMCDLWRW